MIEKGSIVKSLSGHDSGSWYVVIEITDDGYAKIADGRRRKGEKPKRKNIKHLHSSGERIGFDGITNRKLRTELHKFNFGDCNLEKNAEESD